MSVVGRNGIIDVDQDAGLVTGVDAWNADERARGTATTTSNVDLTTGELGSHDIVRSRTSMLQEFTYVELSTTVSLRNMQGDRFHADEVLAGW